MTDLVGRLNERLGGIEVEQFGGDNFAVWLCSNFERADEEGEEDDCGWKPSALAGYEAVTAAIRAHYAPLATALEAANKRIAVLEEALERIASGPARDACWCGACVSARHARAALQGDTTNVAG